MVEFTFFEIHLDDASFKANAPFATAGGDEDEAEWGTEAADGDGGGPNPAKAVLVALVVSVVVAMLVRKLKGGADEPEE